MNPNEVLRIVDAIHRDKKIDKEIVFQAIEAALVSAAKKNYGEDSEIEITIDRQDGFRRADGGIVLFAGGVLDRGRAGRPATGVS